MARKYWLIIFLSIYFSSGGQVLGQDEKSTPITWTKEDQNLGQQFYLSFPELQMPGYRSGYGKNPENSYFPFTDVLKRDGKYKYINNENGDSLFLFVPAYLGLGDYQKFGGTLGSFSLTSNVRVDYGGFIGIQSDYLLSRREIVSGSNLLLKYSISKQLQLLVWGQYILSGHRADPFFCMPSFCPASKLGTALQYDSNEKTKIKVGVEYQYDQSDHAWKPESGGKIMWNF